MKVWTQKDIDAVQPNTLGIRVFPAYCRFEAGCHFEAYCHFGTGCYFEAGCRFGTYCHFAADCYFGMGCYLESQSEPMMTRRLWSAGGIGRDGRTTYAIPMITGVYIRCGCWAGTLDEFREQIVHTHGDNEHAQDYLAVCDLWEKKHKRLLS